MKTAIDLRAEEAEAAGLCAKECGCPVRAPDGATCCKLRGSIGTGCLCGCHGDAESIRNREEARRLLKGAGF